MDILAAWSAGSLFASFGAIVIWASWVAWHRVHGEHVDWW
jgi:hypothetical protein